MKPGYPTLIIQKDIPVLERRKQCFDLPRLYISPHRILDIKLLLLLIELAANDAEVDGIDDEVFEFADRRHVELFLKLRVGQFLTIAYRVNVSCK